MKLPLPDQWTRLTEPRRRVLWQLTQKPERTAQPYYPTAANYRMLTALKLEGLADVVYSPGSFVARATPEGRVLVAEVERRAMRDLCDLLWAWLQGRTGPNF